MTATPTVAPVSDNRRTIMLRKTSIALAVTCLALAAMSAVDSASAFYGGYNIFAWRAVPLYGIPL
jgi:hypothetical protein